jgi:hypothetical protein
MAHHHAPVKSHVHFRFTVRYTKNGKHFVVIDEEMGNRTSRSSSQDTAMGALHAVVFSQPACGQANP